jgi:UDP-N-acetylglucosamine 1-carboxyvinyltransferase
VKVEIEEFGASQTSDVAETKKAHMYHLKSNDLEGKEIILDEFSVTGTENMLMAACLAKGETTLKIAAAEPHVANLAHFLNKMGADIKIEGTNCYKIKGKKKLKGADHEVIPDYLEAGTFIILALAAEGKIKINNVPTDHLELTISKLKKFGGDIKVIEEGVLEVSGDGELEMPKIQAMPYPGIPTDLQSPLGVLATQAKGLTLIHDPMYEGRLKYLEELNKMGTEIVMCDPHRAIINGPTDLHGTQLDPLDLRSGAALIIAGVIANGTTIIKDVSQADRGYEEIEKRLRKIGVDVKRIKE